MKKHQLDFRPIDCAKGALGRSLIRKLFGAIHVHLSPEIIFVKLSFADRHFDWLLENIDVPMIKLLI